MFGRVVGGESVVAAAAAAATHMGGTVPAARTSRPPTPPTWGGFMRTFLCFIRIWFVFFCSVAAETDFSKAF